MAVKFKDLRIPSLREGAAMAAVAALVGFFSMQLYYPPLGIIGNAMNGYIRITNACPEYPPLPPDGFMLDTPANKPAFCGIGFPYRWVLIALVLFVAGCWYAERRKKA